jgi:hypothetical protein
MRASLSRASRKGCPRPSEGVRPPRAPRFQEALHAFGDPELLALKQGTAAGVRAGSDPAALATADGRFGRATIRVALRQMQAIDGASANLRAWRQFHDRVSEDTAEEDEQAQHA